MIVLEIILDLILLGLIGGGVYIGIKKGFISIMAKPVKLFASLLFAYATCGGFANVFVVPFIEAPITNYITDFLYKNCEGLTPVTIADELPTLLKIGAAVFDINVYEIAANAEGDVIRAIVGHLAHPSIYVIAVVISFALVYVIARLLFAGAMFLVNYFFKDGVLGKVNQIMGIVFATALAFIVAWALAGFLEFIFNTPLFAEGMVDFNGGLLYRFFNSFSPIELLLSF